MIRTTVSIFILFVVIVFAVLNSANTSLNLLFWKISVSTSIIIFTTFLVGFVFGVLRVTPSWFKKHSLLNKHHKELNICKKENEENTQRISELEVDLASERQATDINEKEKETLK